jgi:acyl-CoA reductase-like NAD-dependent aldehyde dehydrogenase
MEIRDRLFIDGSWVKPSGDELIDVIDSDTEEVFAKVPRGTSQDANRAVEAARAAFDSWAATSADERGKYLLRINEGIMARMNQLSETISKEVGTPLGFSQFIQVSIPATTFSDMSTRATDYEFEETIGNSLVVKEPRGVVAAITPWNYPLHQIAAKVAPALLAGCTVVLKPADLAPVNAYILADIMEEVGLPAGVFNLVTGPGTEIGEAMVKHPDVDMISFTGSTPVGSRIAQLAANDIKRVALELGGKSATVLLDDVFDGAELEAKAISDALFWCYLNSGQTCIAQTRLLVPKAKLSEVEDRVAEETAGYAIGSPFDPANRVGPLVSKKQQERVRDYIRIGKDEGAKLLTGGDEMPDHLEKGYYVKPTVFTEVDQNMRIAQEEIFGPVLSIIAYDNEKDAIEIANNSSYGLSGSVWSSDNDHAIKVAKQIRTGQVEVNGGMFNPTAPFGGYKKSGYGRELGKYGLEDFLEIKSLQLP